jgi:hypothetical protein
MDSNSDVRHDVTPDGTANDVIGIMANIKSYTVKWVKE